MIARLLLLGGVGALVALSPAVAAESGRVGVALRVIDTPSVVSILEAWPASQRLVDQGEGTGFWATAGAPQQALADLMRFSQRAAGMSVDARALADGWQAWVMAPAGCAHVLARHVGGQELSVTRIEVRPCK